MVPAHARCLIQFRHMADPSLTPISDALSRAVDPGARIERARHGVTVDEAIDTMRAWSIPVAWFAAILGCSERQWGRLRAGAGDALLSPAASDRLLRARRTLDHARAVFDDEPDTVAWLSAPNDALAGESPLSLLDTDAGVRLVEAVLTRVEFGVYS